jgi:tripartite-type tricarboxylate transporter receptor subunit TctC
MKNPKRVFLLGVFLLSVILELAIAADKPYPSQPITCVVPFTPGAATDLANRALGSFFQHYLGQPLITLNKPGGGGTSGFFDMVKSSPDGYTLVTTGATVAMPELYDYFRKAPYAYVDAAPVAQWSVFVPTIAVRKDSPWNTLKQFMDDAKTKGLKFGGPGKTASNYIIGLALAKKYNARLSGIPFEGDAKSIPALLGGHIDMALLMVASVKPHISSGTLKLLAVAHDERISDFPNTPTMIEQGYDVGFGSMPLGTWAPAKTPLQRVAILSDGIRKISEDKSFRDMMEKVGMPVSFADHDTFNKKLDQIKKVLTEIFKDLDYLPK